MSPTIRPCEQTDLAAVLAVSNAVWPDHATTLAMLERAEALRPAHCLCYRLLAELDGVPVGLARASQHESMYDPRKFEVEVAVLPEHRGGGLGAKLYDAVLQSIAEHDPNWLVGWCCEADEVSVGFVTRRGYVALDFEYEQILDLSTFDPADYADMRGRAAAHGVVIRTLDEIRADDGWEQRLLDAVNRLERDVPSTEEFTGITLEMLRTHALESPLLIPEAYLVACLDGAYVGLHNLWRSDAFDGRIEVGLTAVDRDHRRKGIASALKLRGLEWAGSAGVRDLRTYNATTNTGMLSINERLGFVKQPAWIGYHLRAAE